MITREGSKVAASACRPVDGARGRPGHGGAPPAMAGHQGSEGRKAHDPGRDLHAARLYRPGRTRLRGSLLSQHRKVALRDRSPRRRDRRRHCRGSRISAFPGSWKSGTMACPSRPITRSATTAATSATLLTLACSRRPTPKSCTCATAASSGRKAASEKSSSRRSLATSFPFAWAGTTPLIQIPATGPGWATCLAG